jgi:hypothetical protein
MGDYVNPHVILYLFAGAITILTWVGTVLLAYGIIELYKKHHRADTPCESQSRKSSLLEVTTNTLVGLIIAYHAQVYIYSPYTGYRYLRLLMFN